ncbi:hypothetical protein [Thermococcus sp.]
MRKVVYYASVIMASFGLFLPLIYGSLSFVHGLLGSNPLLKSLALSLIFWTLAYLTFEEKEVRVS